MDKISNSFKYTIETLQSCLTWAPAKRGGNQYKQAHQTGQSTTKNIQSLSSRSGILPTNGSPVSWTLGSSNQMQYPEVTSTDVISDQSMDASAHPANKKMVLTNEVSERTNGKRPKAKGWMPTFATYWVVESFLLVFSLTRLCPIKRAAVQATNSAVNLDWKDRHWVSDFALTKFCSYHQSTAQHSFHFCFGRGLRFFCLLNLESS